ncbi:MAG: GerMN domain-containing protein [Actinobacteria bacterium]|nr:GerMN domain-containing protein [Actinomycetota bacterium]
MAFLGVAMLTAACGIPLDDAPRAIEIPSTTAADEPDSTTASADGTVFMYYLSDNLLTAVETEGGDQTPAQVLASLFAGVPEGARTNVSTQIPAGTDLLGTVLSGGSLTIDVSSEFDNLVGSGRTLALAQIVMTVTELDEVRSVSLRIDGVDVPIYSPEAGDTTTVTDCDYRSLFPQSIGGVSLSELVKTVPTPDPDGPQTTLEPSGNDPDLSDEERHLLNRIVAVDRSCGPS